MCPDTKPKITKPNSKSRQVKMEMLKIQDWFPTIQSWISQILQRKGRQMDYMQKQIRVCAQGDPNPRPNASTRGMWNNNHARLRSPEASANNSKYLTGSILYKSVILSPYSKAKQFKYCFSANKLNNEWLTRRSQGTSFSRTPKHSRSYESNNE